MKSAARLVTAAQVFRENPPKRFKRAENCLPGPQSFVGHSAPCPLGAFAGKGPSTSELMLRVHSLCENRPARRRGACKSRHVAPTDEHSHVPVGTDCRLLVPISGSLQIGRHGAVFKVKMPLRLRS